MIRVAQRAASAGVVTELDDAHQSSKVTFFWANMTHLVVQVSACSKVVLLIAFVVLCLIWIYFIKVTMLQLFLLLFRVTIQEGNQPLQSFASLCWYRLIEYFLVEHLVCSS